MKSDILLAASFVLVVLFGCGEKDKNKASLPVSDADGTWASECLDLSSMGAGSLNAVLVNAGGVSTYTITDYSEGSCKTATAVYVNTTTFNTGGAVATPVGAKEYNTKFTSFAVTLKTDSEVAYANAEGEGKICSGGFVKDQTKKLTAAECANDEERKGRFFDIYGIYKLDGNKLYLGVCGKPGTATDCSTAAKRTTELESTPYTKK